MADVKTNLCEFRLRRDGAGIRVTVKTSDELTAAFKTASRDRKETASYTGTTTPFQYWRCGNPCDDAEVGLAVLAVGSNSKDGFTTVLKLPRTKEQLRVVATQISKFLNDFYETHMRVVDISVTVQARLLAVQA